MATFRTKRHDTKPIRMLLQHRDAQTGVVSAVDLAGSTVRFLLATENEVLVASGAATIVDAVNGVVEYEFQPSDTATSGSFLGEFEVVYGTGEVETFPEKNYVKVEIQDDLGNA